MTAWQALGLGCALALVAGIAFSAGLVVGGSGEAPPSAPPTRPAAEPMRQVFSPSLISDPAFLEQQRRNMEALEQACSTSGEYCVEARQVREWLAENGR